MTSDITLSGAVQQAQKTEQQGLKLTEDFDQFLTLLTTQLQNQDPLDPMDSSEFTNQIVQFSQVEQQINMNQKISDLVSLELANSSSVALGYVGLDVSYQSAELNFDGEAPVTVSYALEKDALSATINIVDETGAVVFTADVPRETGAHEFVWDGSHQGGGFVEPGTYAVNVDAFDKDNKFIDNTTVVTGRVRGIETQNGLVFLLIGERAVGLNTIVNAVTPPPPKEEVATDTDAPTPPTPPPTPTGGA